MGLIRAVGPLSSVAFATPTLSSRSKILHVSLYEAASLPITIAYTKVGDSVPLWNWNMVEASVTVFCACLFASKPAVNKLIPEKIISKLGSQSRSWSSSWRNKIPRALHEEGKESIASSPEPPKPAHVGLRRHSQVGGHEDLESHGRGSTAPDVSYSSEKPLPGIPVRGIPAQSAGETMSFTSW